MAARRTRPHLTALLAGLACSLAALAPQPALARTYAERAADSAELVADVIDGMLEKGEINLAAVGAIHRELQRLADDTALEGYSHTQLNSAIELAGSLVQRGNSLEPAEQVAQLGQLLAAARQVAADFAGGFLSSEPEEMPVAGSQTVFDTGVRNWMPFAGVTRSVTEGAEFMGWDAAATIVLVSRRDEIMLSIENGNYTAEWLLPVPYSRSVSFGIDRDNEEFILFSVHAPDASTHFLIDKGGAGQLYVHRR